MMPEIGNGLLCLALGIALLLSVYPLWGVDFPDARHCARFRMGLLRTRLGWLVVLGSGRKRLVYAVAGGDCADALTGGH